MDASANPPAAAPLVSARPRRPFALKALTCFIVSLLCLAWLTSLQWQRAQQARQELTRPKLAALTGAAAQPIKLVEAPQTPSARPLGESDFALAEVEAIHLLLVTGNAIESKSAANALRPYTFSTNSAVRDAARREFEVVARDRDKTLLAAIAASIESAKEQAGKKNFAAAISTLQDALKNMPDDAGLSNETPEGVLRSLIEDYTHQRQQSRDAAFKGLDDGLRRKDPAARTRLEAALADSDPLVVEDAKKLQDKIIDELDSAAGKARNVERAAREQWVRFFKRFGGTVAEGDFSGASEICEQPPFEEILKGGVSDPNKVLRLCSADVQAIQMLYDEALADAKGLRRTVSFHLRKGGQASGTLMGVNGKLLRINPGKGAEMGIKITDLPSDGLKALLDSGIKKKVPIRLALAALEAYENPNEAESIISTAYQKEGQALPLHWSERFRVEKLNAKVKDAEGRLAVLKKAIDAGNGDEVKAALEQSKAIAAELREMGALGDETRKLLALAEVVAAKKQLSSVTLQNGISPDATYKGINSDQISEYRESSRRTDVGVGYGLKLGAAGGLQRALIKFEGLEAIVGNGRVRKAFLELYQIASPASDGASVGAFRVKRAWIPDSGSWMAYDNQKNHDWAIPGASGAEDIEAREDVNVTLDKKTSVWRRLDVTKYIQDVLAGKAQNNGLLLKIVNGEPDYHVRFYPETDLDRAKEKALRPKLVLELAHDAE